MDRLTVTAILACLALMICGAQAQYFGSKVQFGDPDLGLPLSGFGNVGFPVQTFAWLKYWDIGSTPGIFDKEDVVYLQFGGVNAFALNIVRANNIRLTGWGSYSPGTKVNPADNDIGQQVYPLPSPFGSGAATGFYFMEVDGAAGYSLGDPIYLKVNVPATPVTNTNDIRISTVNSLAAGTKILDLDPDNNMPLIAFKTPGFGAAAGGPAVATTLATPPVASLGFFNMNGNTNSDPAVGTIGTPIFDSPDLVYLDIEPLGEISINDVRLFEP